MAVNLPDFADIEAAAARLAPYNVETPLIENADLNALAGRRVLLKLECLQRTGSFKFRGACNKIAGLSESERQRGVVAFSSGNHAQGVAAAAALFKIPALIVMPKDVPAAKLQGTRARGAEVVFYDRLHDDREAIAQKICDERQAILIRPFDDAAIVAGQGTAGLELARQAAQKQVRLSAVLVPCSGGGLVSGIALALSVCSPASKVFSVEPENYDGMRRSLGAGLRSAAPGGPLSIADALMAPVPGVIPFALAKKYLAGGLCVNDAVLQEAVAYAAHTLKLVVEPGGAAALAALIANQYQAEEEAIAVILSGGNRDLP